MVRHLRPKTSTSWYLPEGVELVLAIAGVGFRLSAAPMRFRNGMEVRPVTKIEGGRLTDNDR